jgi:hypothetical protein
LCLPFMRCPPLKSAGVCLSPSGRARSRIHPEPVIDSSLSEGGMDAARRGLYQVLVQKQLRIFVAVLRLISIPTCEVIYEQVPGKTPPVWQGWRICGREQSCDW